MDIGLNDITKCEKQSNFVIAEDVVMNNPAHFFAEKFDDTNGIEHCEEGFGLYYQDETDVNNNESALIKKCVNIEFTNEGMKVKVKDFVDQRN